MGEYIGIFILKNLRKQPEWPYYPVASKRV